MEIDLSQIEDNIDNENNDDNDDEENEKNEMIIDDAININHKIMLMILKKVLMWLQWQGLE
jgi:hypothetical protein